MNKLTKKEVEAEECSLRQEAEFQILLNEIHKEELQEEIDELDNENCAIRNNLGEAIFKLYKENA